MIEPWRFISVETADGPTNMALDEAILTLVGEGHSPPTVRFYDWSSPWVSLGSGQTSADLDAAELNDRGWGIIRRPSGGTAVLHQGQLGFAIILPINNSIWHGDLIASYERLSVPFALAFGRLGIASIPSHPGDNARFIQNAPAIAAKACFGSCGPYELLANGRKIIGNSQVRRRHSATQHGVIQVTGGQSDLADVLATESSSEREELRNYLAQHVGSIENQVSAALSPTRLAETIVTALVETLSIVTEVGTFDDRERALAADLIETKYGNRSWSYRR